MGGTFIENNGNALRNGIIDKGSEQFKEKIMDIHHVYVEGQTVVSVETNK